LTIVIKEDKMNIKELYMKKFSEIIRGIDIHNVEYSASIRETVERIKQKYDDYHPQYLGLRLAFGKSITVYTITDGALGFIKNTPIMEFPARRPLFLSAPFIIEGRKEEPLFDDIIALGGFVDQDAFSLIAIYQNGGHVNIYEIRAYEIYKGKKFDEVQFNIDEETKAATTDKQRKILSWTISLGVMLESARTPVLIENKNKKKDISNNAYKKNNHIPNWYEKRIYIDSEYVKELQLYANEHHELNKEGKLLKNIIIHGYYRMQHYGKNNEEVKYIFIAPFNSSRWTNDKDTKIIVDTIEK
jgi:hypothetical protein